MVSSLLHEPHAWTQTLLRLSVPFKILKNCQVGKRNKTINLAAWKKPLMKCLKIPLPRFYHGAIKLGLNMVRTQAWARFKSYPGDFNVQTTMKMTALDKAGQHAMESSVQGVDVLQVTQPQTHPSGRGLLRCHKRQLWNLMSRIEQITVAG